MLFGFGGVQWGRRRRASFLPGAVLPVFVGQILQQHQLCRCLSGEQEGPGVCVPEPAIEKLSVFVSLCRGHQKMIPLRPHGLFPVEHQLRPDALSFVGIQHQNQREEGLQIAEVGIACEAGALSVQLCEVDLAILYLLSDRLTDQERILFVEEIEVLGGCGSNQEMGGHARSVPCSLARAKKNFWGDRVELI